MKALCSTVVVVAGLLLGLLAAATARAAPMARSAAV
jgi:hypothetical protein